MEISAIDWISSSSMIFLFLMNRFKSFLTKLVITSNDFDLKHYSLAKI